MDGDADAAIKTIDEHMNRYLEHLLEIKRAAPHYFKVD